MSKFFHYDTTAVKRRVAVYLLPVLTMLFLIAFIATITGILTFRFLVGSGAVRLVIGAAAAAVSAGVIYTAVLLDMYFRCGIRDSRYTFIDIQPRYIILSLYAGDYNGILQKTDKAATLRKLYVCPLENLREVKINKHGKVVLTADDGAIRPYEGCSDRLSYYFVAGKLKMSEWWHNESGFKKLSKMTVPSCFMPPMPMFKTFVRAKHMCDDIPPEKPYKFEEMPFVRMKKLRRTRDADGTYDRKW